MAKAQPAPDPRIPSADRLPGAAPRDRSQDAIERVRFTTSHPFDAHEELFRAIADSRTVCESLHLPVQSGSDRLLRAMRRGYTRESYLAQIARLRALVPEVALSTDIIVGFPGETEADFEATCALMERVRYDSAFVFKYSPRPGTEAAGWPDDVPQPVRERRNRVILELQGRISREKLATSVGGEVEVLVEERNRRGQLSGKNRGNTTVVFDGPDPLIGELTVPRDARHRDDDDRRAGGPRRARLSSSPFLYDPLRRRLRFRKWRFSPSPTRRRRSTSRTSLSMLSTRSGPCESVWARARLTV